MHSLTQKEGEEVEKLYFWDFSPCSLIKYHTDCPCHIRKLNILIKKNLMLAFSNLQRGKKASQSKQNYSWRRKENGCAFVLSEILSGIAGLLFSRNSVCVVQTKHSSGPSVGFSTHKLIFNLILAVKTSFCHTPLITCDAYTICRSSHKM